MTEAKIRVVLVDDHAMFRGPFAFTIEHRGVAEVVGEASDGDEGIQVVLDTKPDVVVMDVRMPRLSGPDAAREILRHLPSTRILFLSGYSEPREVTAAVGTGASGYLLKTATIEEILAAIPLVHEGASVYDPSLTEFGSDDHRQGDSNGHGPTHFGLTDREREIVGLLAGGYTSTDIAERFGITPDTVDGLVRDITDKLGVETVNELTRFAIEQGLDQHLN